MSRICGVWTDVNREVWGFVGMRDSSLGRVPLRMAEVRDIKTAKQV
jgi:hypothetical protein